MSAYMVGKPHIDALLTAGLILPRPHGPLSWLWPAVTEADREAAYDKGEPWGRGAIALYNERRRELTDDTAGFVGAMLLAENRRSIDHRYNEEELEEPYLFTRLRGRVDPVIVLKAIACFRYQACEHPTWPDSEAYAFCLSLEAITINRLPGYQEAPGWEVHDPNVFLTHEHKGNQDRD